MRLSLERNAKIDVFPANLLNPAEHLLICFFELRSFFQFIFQIFAFIGTGSSKTPPPTRFIFPTFTLLAESHPLCINSTKATSDSTIKPALSATTHPLLSHHSPPLPPRISPRSKILAFPIKPLFSLARAQLFPNIINELFSFSTITDKEEEEEEEGRGADGDCKRN